MSVRDERSFRIAYERVLREHGAFYAYMSSMNRHGIPDLFVQHRGIGSWQELKFAEHLSARTKTGALGHKFTGPQRAFLRGVTENAGLGIGVVGHLGASGGVQVSYVFSHEIEDDGQVTVGRILDVTADGRTVPLGRGCLDILCVLMGRATHHARDRCQLKLM